MASEIATATPRRSTESLVIGLALVCVVVALDFLTGTEISFSIFYVAPIARVAWYSGRRWGFAFATLSAVAWFAADQLGGHIASHPLIAVWNGLARMLLFALTVYVAATLHSALERERALARLDQLTSLNNSRAFRETAAKEIERLERYGDAFSLAYLDVDNFKQVNDEFGHQAGDKVLTHVGQTLQEKLRRTDYPARLGGDEFAVLMPKTRLEPARSAIDKVLSELDGIAKEHGWPISFSVGLVCFEEPPRHVDEMVQVADAVMYEVKRGTKAAVRTLSYERSERSSPSANLHRRA